MPPSVDTLIRRVKGAARWPALPRVLRFLGVDDWAWRKGQNFSTILVDLERSQVVDLLPTRSADAFGEWLARHPEVTTVTRDRQGVYAEGARRGAPKAVQGADRFHLVLNSFKRWNVTLLSIGDTFKLRGRAHSLCRHRRQRRK